MIRNKCHSDRWRFFWSCSTPTFRENQPLDLLPLPEDMTMASNNPPNWALASWSRSKVFQDLRALEMRLMIFRRSAGLKRRVARHIAFQNVHRPLGALPGSCQKVERPDYSKHNISVRVWDDQGTKVFTPMNWDWPHTAANRRMELRSQALSWNARPNTAVLRGSRPNKQQRQQGL